MKKNNLVKVHERLDDLQYNGLYIIQDPNKYCFNSDSIALANFIKVKSKEKMVDLCAGSGVIGILAMAKGKGQSCILVELQESMANMAQRSIEYNKIDNISVVCDKIQNIHQNIGQESYDVVCCNPPYQTDNGNLKNEDYSVALCRHEIAVKLEEVILEASKLLKFGGRFYIVHKAKRLAEIMYLCKTYKMEPKRLKVLPSTKGMQIVLVEAVKGGKEGLLIEE